MNIDNLRTSRLLRLRGPGGIPWTLTLLVCFIYLGLLTSLAAGALPIRSDDSTQTDDLGCGPAQVTHRLNTGSAWRMCIRIDDLKGLVLENVQFRPATGNREYSGWMPVIDSLYLAQLVVPYDTGTVAFNDLTEFGFGGGKMLLQTKDTCLGETLPVSQSVMVGSEYSERAVPGICLNEIGTGLGWHAREDSAREDAARYSQQGRALEVSSLTKISWYEYQQKITLTDQGTITVGLGATGDLAPGMYIDDPAVTSPMSPGDEHDEPGSGHAASHWHNAVYRVDFGIGSGAQQVQQWDYTRPNPSLPSRVEGTGTIRTEAFNADDEPDPQTWWRVLNPTSLNPDGHTRSYEIVNNSIQNPSTALTRPKVSFTNNHACQEYASDNKNGGCPGLSVPDYVAAETDPLTDPVAWVNVGFHHIARDEDQSPMPAHWQEFSLVPRDLLAQQATTPIERSCINGEPVTLYGSCAAINLAVPRITANTTPVRVGTKLTSTTGNWTPGRSPLSYQRLWLRDGKPITTVSGGGLITSAIGEHYTVTTADLGHRISVRVDAAAAGVIPGSATSAALKIPTASTQPGISKKVSPRLKVTLQRANKARPRLLIKVKGTQGKATGKVLVRKPGGWKQTRVLANGRVKVPVPKALVRKKTRLVVRYRGDTHYLPVQQKIRVRTRK